MLETIDMKERLSRVIEIINNEKEVLSREKIGQRVKRSMERTQKGILFTRANESDPKGIGR